MKTKWWRRVRRPLSKRVLLPGVIAFVGLFGAGPAAAQSDVPLDVRDVDQSSSPYVTFTVTAPRELLGRELGAEHFTVIEGGERRQPSVTKLNNETLEVVLVIDTSGSMKGAPMAAAKDAAVSFVGAMPVGTRIAVVGFGTEPKVARPLVSDPKGLVAAIDALQASGETALYDAVLTVTDQLGAAANPDARRVVVLLSDGGDTASVKTVDDAVAGLASVDTSFYAVALATSESDLGALGRLAQATDGRVVAASEPSEIASVYEDIASRLVNEYELRYRSAAEGPAELEVVLEAEGIVARSSQTVEFEALPEAAAASSAPPEVVRPYTAPEAPWIAQEWTLLAGAVPLTLALAVAGFMLVGAKREPKRRRLARELGSAIQGEATSVVANMRGRATALADRVLAQNEERSGKLNAMLERAGLAIRPGEFLVFAVSVVIGGTFIGLLVFGPIMALVAGAVLTVGVWQGLKYMESRRQKLLADQLPDTLQLLAGSLRAGHGLVQALDQVTREADAPTSEEFHRVIVEARLGRDLAEALDGMAQRAGNEDVEWVVQAIRIHREVGGDLAEIMDRVGDTIRDRNRVRGQIRSLTAEGRLSAIILMALPFLVGGWMWITNRPYVNELFTRSGGRVILGVGALLMGMGAMVLHKLVKPEF